MRPLRSWLRDPERIDKSVDQEHQYFHLTSDAATTPGPGIHADRIPLYSGSGVATAKMLGSAAKYTPRRRSH
jgi:hypothetical protein